MDDIGKLFEQINSEVLTEETKLSMAILFENAVQECVKAKEVKLEEENKAKLVEFKESLIEQVDKYLDYFVEEFTKKNAGVIEDSVKVNTAERVLKTFSTIVEDFHLQLEPKKIDAEAMVSETKKQLNDVTKELIEAKKQIKAGEKASIVLEAAHKLTTDVQKEKLAAYAKNLQLDDLFEKKVNAFVTATLVEAKSKETKKPIVEKIVIKEEKVEEVDRNPVNKYLEKL